MKGPDPTEAQLAHCADLAPALALAILEGDADAIDNLIDAMHDQIKPQHGIATLVTASALTVMLDEVLGERGLDTATWLRQRMERPQGSTS